MNWEINKITILNRDFNSPSLKVKSVKRSQDWGYWVELEGKITFPNSDPNNENKIRVLRRSYKNTIGNNSEENKEIDVFYFFVNKIGKETKIPFRAIAYDNPQDVHNRKVFFRLSDSEVDNGENKGEINAIILEEKKKWDNFGYKRDEDLVQENKPWVDEEVYQKYKIAFQGTDLADNPKEVKKWQDTKLDDSEVKVACQNGWSPNEIQRKIGSLDGGKSYLYDSVLTLQKRELQELNEQLTRKIQEVATISEGERELLTELERIRADWSSGNSEKKAILEVNKGHLDKAIESIKDKLIIKKLNAQIRSLEGQVGGKGANLAQIQAELESKKEKINELNQQIQALQGMLTAGPTNRPVTNPVTDNKTSQEQITALQKEIAELTELLTQVNLANTEANRQTAKANQQIADLQQGLIVQVVVPPKGSS